MDPLTSTVASGMRARLEALDMLANNIANASTTGFKKDGEFYGIFRGELDDAEPTADTEMPVIQKNWTDLSQGTLQTTGASLDFALSGPGWFKAQSPSGPLYTRNGNFQVSSTGVVTTQEGYPVLLAGGGTLRVQPGSALIVAPDGTLTQNGAQLGKLDVIEFGEGELLRHGASFFRPTAATNIGKPATGTELLQGKLENANVSAPESAVRLVGLTRQFEGLQRALQIGSEMNKRSVEELAKV